MRIKFHHTSIRCRFLVNDKDFLVVIGDQRAAYWSFPQAKPAFQVTVLIKHTDFVVIFIYHDQHEQIIFLISTYTTDIFVSQSTTEGLERAQKDALFVENFNHLITFVYYYEMSLFVYGNVLCNLQLFFFFGALTKWPWKAIALRITIFRKRFRNSYVAQWVDFLLFHLNEGPNPTKFVGFVSNFSNSANFVNDTISVIHTQETVFGVFVASEEIFFSASKDLSKNFLDHFHFIKISKPNFTYR